MIGVEIDMVVADSLKALELYERIFDIERIEVTDFSKGENEVVFSLYDVRFHMLDENEAFELNAPNLDDPKPIWFNIMVPDIEETFRKAMESGCTEVQEVIEMPDYGVSNAMFSDMFGYLWMLHEVHREVGFEERVKLWEDRRADG
ncbi:VOC family protein [Salinicoccus hispanicus]|uniref:VOC family protein n=1 Tax=Salinicoccus hispanicus TaxID=157225 RepID=A0A6N8U1G7_9STAP|nr:VOC family protein [Salinicoccus hispanicus]MXQ51920.1 VOC family protein [Salinicoccus hispanicus]